MKRLLMFLGLLLFFSAIMLGVLQLRDYKPPTNDGINKEPLSVVETVPEPVLEELSAVEYIEPGKPVVAVVAPPVGSGDCSLVNNYSWDTRVAYAVCMAESNGNPNASNWGDNHGSCMGSFSLMQVGCFWYPYFGFSENDRYNGSVNMEIAFRIWQRQGGFGAWTTYTSGKYLRYM